MGLAALSAGPLLLLWSLPAGPFGLKKDNTAYDARKDIELFAAAIPPGGPRGPDIASDARYERYGADVMAAARGGRWFFQMREETAIARLSDPLDEGRCVFGYAFLLRVGIPDAWQCTTLYQGVQAAAREGYPPAMLELAAQARAEQRFVDAEALAREALAAGTAIGWAAPAAFLARFHFQNGGYDEALADTDAGLDIAVRWRNRNAALELYSMRSEVLRTLGREGEANLAARCARGESLALPCPLLTPHTDAAPQGPPGAPPAVDVASPGPPPGPHAPSTP